MTGTTETDRRSTEKFKAEMRAFAERDVQIMLTHMSMTPEQRRAAEAKVEARTGSRKFHIEDLVAAHEETEKNMLPKGYYLVDLAEA